MQPKKFVLKGGPQSGKTTLFRTIKRHFGEEVLFFPEVASVLLGDLWPKIERDADYHKIWLSTLQRGIFHSQRGLEELALSMATTKGIPLIGHDRGVFDSAGYLGVSGRELASIFDESFEEMMSRYDLVIHLDTIATLHPKDFGNATNAARYESAEEAIAVDERIWHAYDGHPHHIRIPACEDFETKQTQVLSLITGLLSDVSLAASLM